MQVDKWVLSPIKAPYKKSRRHTHSYAYIHTHAHAYTRTYVYSIYPHPYVLNITSTVPHNYAENFVIILKNKGNDTS